ncbi:S41 family peptidase [Mucilaginibacter aquariorum]|uniref:S41 family peptidase n=1 Tax=Mucilaginibacter aquariorum TaxID=2967225 RepID=A0ABT1SYL2_9SPHI|nr:S41 family peptidase [Mucilaginibacter aquariorum]MCQ6957156.1 S41 family peptidase [Mucilaginibacter aquariorum]
MRYLITFLFCYRFMLADAQDSLALKAYPTGELYADYDLLISALKEAHTGLYWYNSYREFDSVATGQRAKIHKGMNGLDFYQVIAPIVGFTKEGHTSLRLSKQLQNVMRLRAVYLPAFIKISKGKVYMINNLNRLQTKGCELVSVNGVSGDSLLRRFMSYEPSDGFNLTGKYRWIEENAKFNQYYARCYPFVKSFEIIYKDPSGVLRKLSCLPLNLEQFRAAYTIAIKAISNSNYSLPATLETDSVRHLAILTFNTFQKKRYTAAGMEFRDFVSRSFTSFERLGINKLIIDIRRNGGGTEGYEDYLLSFMTDKDYIKYNYVQASAFHYSFYRYTDYAGDWAELDSALRAEHYLEKDGRILRKPGIEEHEKPHQHSYMGKIVVLTSGLTYSGGSEFASLMRNHTAATFVGEETGGGYYGNTSGYKITLQLPHTGLEIGIPLLKFVVATPKADNPFGHGVIPDIVIEPTIADYLKGLDVELQRAKEIIMK